MAASNNQGRQRRQLQAGPFTRTNQTSTSLNQWFGETTITSRHEFVAAPLVAATSVIFHGVKWLGHTNSMALGYSFCISSIQAGSGFYISTVNSVAFAATSAPSLAVFWEIKNPR